MNDAKSHPAKTGNPSERAKVDPARARPHSQAALPDAATLKPSGGDPYYQLSRSWWYDLERRGLVRLTRVRLPGNRKPRVLLRRDDAAAAIAKLSQGQERDARIAKTPGANERPLA